MQTKQRKFATGFFVAVLILLSAHSARADNDIETCQAGYNVLLMTAGECRAWLGDLRAAQARADYAAMLDLQEWHTELLIERSQSCPCRPVAPGWQGRPAARPDSRLAARSARP